MGRVFATITIGLALVLATVVAYFGVPVGLLPIPDLAQLGLAAPSGPTAQLTFAVDEEELRARQLDETVERMAAVLREASPSVRYNGRGVTGDAARVRLVEEGDAARALQLLRAQLGSSDDGVEMAVFNQGPDSSIEARVSATHLAVLRRAAAAQSVEVVRRRIPARDRRAVTIELTADSHVLVRAVGVRDPEQLRRLVGTTGRLTFHTVRDDLAADRLPSNAMLALPHPASHWGPEVLVRRPSLGGEHIARASLATDTYTGEFVVSLTFDREGTRRFCRLTREQTGKRFAVLLDGRVLTAPLINEPICGGTAQISGNFTSESAKELAIMLSAGALPAPLKLIDERIDSNTN